MADRKVLVVNGQPLKEYLAVPPADEQLKAWCAKCNRQVSRVGYLESDDNMHVSFRILCHGDERRFSVSRADLLRAKIVSATFFDEKAIGDTGQIGHIT